MTARNIRGFRIRGLVASLLMPTGTMILSAPASAQEAEVKAPQTASSLPLPDYHFQGTVGRTLADPDPAKFPALTRPPKGAPNVVVILLDDVGFGQFSVTGGGVPSPAMERLAKDGVVYNQFHTSALCSPTRAAFLTGRNEHASGMGNITELATAYDGYTSLIQRETATISEILKQYGYATAWIGKNHDTPVWEASALGPFDHTPNGLGFDYFYGFNSGDTSQFEPVLVENHIPVPRSTDPNYHLTPDLADHAINWLKQAAEIDPDRPYFLYFAPAATHAPHQTTPDWIAKFVGKGLFDMGWDVYRELTLERQKKLGMVPPETKLTKRPEDLAAWDTLNADQKRLYTRMVDIFAAYGAQVDFDAGRVLETVRQMPRADNTLIFYIVGDNGASAEGHFDGTTNEQSGFNGVDQTWQQILPKIDQLGTKKFYNHMPSAWAWAMNTPFQWAKQTASHFGGTRNPLIVSWQGHIKTTGVRSQFHYITDIFPTILEATGIPMPQSVNGVAQRPLDGISMMYSFDHPEAKSQRRTQVFEMVANRAIYHDGWVAAALAFKPWQSDRTGFDIDKVKWELYDIEKDFSEADNLADKEPARLRAMQDLWWVEAAKANILPLDWRGVERFSDAVTGRPSPTAGRTEFVYTTRLSRLPESAAPDLKNKSFSVGADLDIPAGGADGVLFAQGGITAGWSFYLKDRKFVAVHSFIDMARYRVTSKEDVPDGKVKLEAVFEYAGKAKEFGKGGTMILKANGKEIGRGEIEHTAALRYSLYEGQDVGSDDGSPVDDAYEAPFPYSGKIDKVTVDLK
jgi:arylsulfatase A-like enzyme